MSFFFSVWISTKRKYREREREHTYSVTRSNCNKFPNGTHIPWGSRYRTLRYINHRYNSGTKILKTFTVEFKKKTIFRVIAQKKLKATLKLKQSNLVWTKAKFQIDQKSFLNYRNIECSFSNTISVYRRKKNVNANLSSDPNELMWNVCGWFEKATKNGLNEFIIRQNCDKKQQHREPCG